ncbi:MAG: DUF917 family protein [Firmicutes bacterium]|nr:DUF917 family protein [Bacillota bacterium]
MMRLNVDREFLHDAVIGGALLGGGGGGSMDEGLREGLLALDVGPIKLVSVDELAADDVLATVSSVGAPAATERFVQPVDYVEAVRLLQESARVPLAGLITSENGGSSTVNGWFQAAILGIPVVDAPCNGRAHPTGLMGAMGLHRKPGYRSVQTAVGGDPDKGRRIRMVVEGSMNVAAAAIRRAAVDAGGLVAVARNPVTVSYVREHAAVGAIGLAARVGRAMREAMSGGGPAVAAAAAGILNGNVVAQGRVSRFRLVTEGGFDYGQVAVQAGDDEYELSFWNEYMTLESSGQRLGTFPDLLATIAADSGLPVSGADIREGMDVVIVYIPAGSLPLGAGMRDPELFRAVEEVIGQEVVSYAFPESGAR